MSERLISDDGSTTSYILKAHSLVKKAQEAEHFGFLDNAIEFHIQASNYFSLAITQTNNEQTISALKNLSSSPPSSFWSGIEKLLDILPKPIFGVRPSSNRKSQNYTNNGSQSVDGSLMNSFFFMDPDPNLNTSTTNNQFVYNNNNNNINSNSSVNNVYNCNNIVNNNNNNNSNSDLYTTATSFLEQQQQQQNEEIVEEEEEDDESIYDSNSNNSSININLLLEQNRKLKQELRMVNDTVKILIDDSQRTARYLANVTQENTFLKKCILQVRNEIEKKTFKQRVNNNVSTSQSQSQHLHNESNITSSMLSQPSPPTTTTSTIPVSISVGSIPILPTSQSTTTTTTATSNSINLISPSVTTPPFLPPSSQSTTTISTTTSTPGESSIDSSSILYSSTMVNPNSLNITSLETTKLLEEIRFLKSQLEQKDQTIEFHKKRWNQLIESAKKKRE
eukprot:gene3288-4119_t